MNVDIETLDTPPNGEEIKGNLEYNVMISTLEDRAFGEADFDRAFHIFDEMLEKNLDLDVDIPSDQFINIEASLEPSILDDWSVNQFDNDIVASPSFDGEKKPIDTKYNNFLNQHSCTDDIEFGTLSTKILAIGQDDGSQRKVQPVNVSDNQHQESHTISSTQRKNTLLVKTDENLCAPLKKKTLEESTNKPLSLIDGNKYCDFSLITDEDAVASIKYDHMTGRKKELFPVKLHKIMEYSERYGFSSIISWMPHGRSFKIHHEGNFVERVMSNFFFQSKMSSFKRQLKMYGFHKIICNSNVDKGAYFHEMFLRSRPGLCHGIVRLDKPCTLHQKDGPSFYLYPPMPSSNQTGDAESKCGTPKCIRYSDKPVLPNEKKSSNSSRIESSMSNAVIQNSYFGPSTTPLQICQHLDGLPDLSQLMSGNGGKNISAIYVLQGAPISTNFPGMHYFRSYSRLS